MAFGAVSKIFTSYLQTVIANTTALGAIWEVAGRSSDGHTPQGASMIRSIKARDGEAADAAMRTHLLRQREALRELSRNQKSRLLA